MQADDDLLRELSAHATRWMGFSPEALRLDSLRQVIGSAASAGRMLERIRAGEPSALQWLSAAVSVGETYFFRDPTQFHFIVSLLGSLPLSADRCLRAWSAGCATGEEAYSVAALLVSSARARFDVEVLGTDIVATAVERARMGRFSRWSVRPSAPVCFPLFGAAGPDTYEVLPELKRVTRFEQQNLLHDSVPEEAFQLILCRNVLVYFSKEAQRRVCERLARALVPGGCVLFGSMDLPEPPPGLERVGTPELFAYRRPQTAPEPRSRPAASPPLSVPRSVRSGAEAQRPTPVARHLEALALIERGHTRPAVTLIEGLTRAAPEYLPALLDHALLLQRHGERTRAIGVARTLLEGATALPPETMVTGPEDLPASFYVVAAEAFLRRGGR